MIYGAILSDGTSYNFFRKILISGAPIIKTEVITDKPVLKVRYLKTFKKSIDQ